MRIELQELGRRIRPFDVEVIVVDCTCHRYAAISPFDRRNILARILAPSIYTEVAICERKTVNFLQAEK